MISDVEALPATRKEALASGSEFYFTGKPCKWGHIEKRCANNGNCLQCRKDKYWENRDRILAHKVEYYRENKDRRAKYDAQYYRKNVDRIRKRKREYRKENAEYEREWRREYLARKKEEDPEAWRLRTNYYSQRRRATVRNAAVPWADQTKIYSFYWLRAAKSEVYGIEYHVDHIVPLNNPLVCGLHNEFNLQVIPASENRSKGNSFIPH